MTAAGRGIPRAPIDEFTAQGLAFYARRSQGAQDVLHRALHMLLVADGHLTPDGKLRSERATRRQK